MEMLKNHNPYNLFSNPPGPINNDVSLAPFWHQQTETECHLAGTYNDIGEDMTFKDKQQMARQV